MCGGAERSGAVAVLRCESRGDACSVYKKGFISVS